MLSGKSAYSRFYGDYNDVQNLNKIISDLSAIKFTSASKSKINQALVNINTSTSIVGSIAVLKKQLTNLKTACSYLKEIEADQSEIENTRRKLPGATENEKNTLSRKIESLQNTISSYSKKIENLLD